jgi:hypothetical protein
MKDSPVPPGGDGGRMGSVGTVWRCSRSNDEIHFPQYMQEGFFRPSHWKQREDGDHGIVSSVGNNPTVLFVEQGSAHFFAYTKEEGGRFTGGEIVPLRVAIQ